MSLCGQVLPIEILHECIFVQFITQETDTLRRDMDICTRNPHNSLLN